MNKDLQDKIVLPARKIIKEDIKIKKFYLIPWLLSIIFLTWLLVYQVIYTYVEVFWNNKEEVLRIILNFLESDYWIEALIIWLIFVWIYILMTPIFEWWLIKYIDYKNRWETISSIDAIWQWIYKFLPLFKFNNTFSEFKIMSILNFYLFILRFIWLEYIKILSYIFLVIFIFWFIINIMMAYAKYSIVIWNKWVFEAIWESSKIAILNMKTTIKLYFLMLWLNIRVILNFIIFLFFPIAIVLAIWYISTKFLLMVTVIILSIIFILLIVIIWYLTAVLEVFRTSVWYYAYKEGIIKLEDEESKKDK